jgi:predicted Zn-dependent peptidase
MAVGTEVGAEVTRDALHEIFHETERLRTENVSAEELDLVKNIMMGEVMRILDGPFGIADVTIENVQNGTDNSYLDGFLRRVKSITPEEVRATAEKYLAPEEFTTVIVGTQ